MANKDYEKALIIRGKIAKVVNIVLSVISIIAVIITAFLCALNKIDIVKAGIIIPLSLIVYLLMGVLSLVGSKENRKAVMIVYIIAISICGILLFVSIIYSKVH